MAIYSDLNLNHYKMKSTGIYHIGSAAIFLPSLGPCPSLQIKNLHHPFYLPVHLVLNHCSPLDNLL